MKLTSNSISKGKIHDKHGHRGEQFVGRNPNRSLHIAWSDVPSGTKSLCLMMLDHDAIPVLWFFLDPLGCFEY